MEDIKRIFKHAWICSFVIAIYGLCIWNKYVLLGTFSGSLVSILVFYNLAQDVKTQVYAKDDSRRRAFLRYLKRYIFCGIYLGILGKYFGLEMILSAGIGLLNIKLNILFLPIFQKIKNYSRKEE